MTKNILTKLITLGTLSAVSISSMTTLALNHNDNSTEVSTVIKDTKASSATLNADKQQLMAKLAKLDFFSANFIQKIFSDNGELLQQGAGKLAISKPNLVNWQTTEPDETFIVSDGETLWFYDPFIEQATAYNLANSIHNTPILLLTSNDVSLWQQYAVNKNADNFVITPLAQNSQIQSLTVSFSSKGQQEQLSEFSFVDATGQISTVTLNDFDANAKPAQSLFEFSLPQGVRLEDKR